MELVLPARDLGLTNYTRYVVGWMVAHRESGALAKRLISQSVAK